MRRSIILVVLMVILSSFVYAELFCEVRQNSCNSGEIQFFEMQELTNAQASIDDSYPFKVCCSSDDSIISNDCWGTFDFIVHLSDESNAHVQNPHRFSEYALLNSNVSCLSTSTPGLTVTMQYTFDTCPAEFECIAAMSGENNAMVARCDTAGGRSNSFGYVNICARVGPPNQCRSCGEGWLNQCDRVECDDFTEGCFFLSPPVPNECIPCNEASRCEDYDGDELTCIGGDFDGSPYIGDPCGFGTVDNPCAWDDDGFCYTEGIWTCEDPAQTPIDQCTDGTCPPGSACGLSDDGAACECTVTEFTCENPTLTPPDRCEEGTCEEGSVCGGNADSTACECNAICNNNGVCEPELGETVENCDDCTGPWCGDGVINQFWEECEPPNTATCNNNCEDCTSGGCCGDGTQDPGEECDDGNTDSFDGCSQICENEEDLFCGDDEVNQGFEECDDGNNVNGDGCSSRCTWDDGGNRGNTDPTCHDTRGADKDGDTYIDQTLMSDSRYADNVGKICCGEYYNQECKGGDCDDLVTDDPEECHPSWRVNCNSFVYSRCAECINPGVPERCGDGVDNNCNCLRNALGDSNGDGIICGEGDQGVDGTDIPCISEEGGLSYKNVIRTEKIVYYMGRPVRMIIDTFER